MSKIPVYILLTLYLASIGGYLMVDTGHTLAHSWKVSLHEHDHHDFHTVEDHNLKFDVPNTGKINAFNFLNGFLFFALPSAILQNNFENPVYPQAGLLKYNPHNPVPAYPPPLS